jgi:hypothetical protein
MAWPPSGWDDSLDWQERLAAAAVRRTFAARHHLTTRRARASLSSPLKKWNEGGRSKFSVIVVRRKTSSRRKLDQTPTFSTGC